MTLTRKPAREVVRTVAALVDCNPFPAALAGLKKMSPG
jgi:hypothetical protein